MPNTEQRRFWNEEGGDHWVAHQAVHDGMLAGFHARLFEAAALAPGTNLLDIGCGCGTTTLAAARAVAPGAVLGIDLSEPMLEVAKAQARADGLDNARFEAADAQIHRFEPGAFDIALSRFGVMFFEDPVAAFANVRGALGTSGRLVFVCWQPLSENPWLAVPGAAMRAVTPVPPPVPPADAPGPFAFADRDRVTTILEAAGFTAITIDGEREPMRYPGQRAEDVAQLVARTGMGRVLLADADADTAARIIDAAVGALRPFETPEGLVTEGAAWVVQAINP